MRGCSLGGPLFWRCLYCISVVLLASCAQDALKVLRDLVNTLNKYMRDVASPPVFLLRACVDFISEILEVSCVVSRPFTSL